VRRIDFWFDPISPYAWLASRQLAPIEAAGGDLVFRPVLFGALLDAHGTVGPAEVRDKRAYTIRDVLRCAASLGLTVAGPPAHPFNPLKALRMCVAIDDAAQRRRFALAVMDAVWAQGLDVTDDAVLARLAADNGLEAARLAAAALDPAIKAKLVQSTADALAAGVFGVPSFALDGEIFWGADRIDALVRALAGLRIDEQQLARILARQLLLVRPPWCASGPRRSARALAGLLSRTAADS
jgi:2-hydroxychromene-2-carboxylate isomerase